MTKHLLICLNLLAATGAVTGCTTPAEKPATTEATRELPAQTFAKQWVADLDLPKGQKTQRLYLRDNQLYAYSDQNAVYCLNRDAGTLAYVIPHVAPPGHITHAPIVMNDRVAIPTSATVEVFNRHGDLIRTQELGYSTSSDGVATGSLVFIGTNQEDGRLACVDTAKDYAYNRWSLITGSILGTPASYEGVIYVGSQDGGVRAVTEDRAGVWGLPHSTFQTDKKVIADIKVDASGIYIAATDTRLYCVDRATGKLKWQYFALVSLEQAPELTSASVYLPVPGAGLVCLNKIEGDYLRKPKWTAPSAAQFLAEDDKFTYARADDNSLLALDKETGEVKFHSGPTGFVAFAPNTKDGIVYAATAAGQVLAVKPVTVAGQVGEMVLAPVMPGVRVINADAK